MKSISIIFIWFFGISLNCLGPNLCNGFIFSPDQSPQLTKSGERFENKKPDIANNIHLKNEKHGGNSKKGDDSEYDDYTYDSNRAPAKKVTAEQLVLSRKKILAENGIPENQ